MNKNKIKETKETKDISHFKQNDEHKIRLSSSDGDVFVTSEEYSRVIENMNKAIKELMTTKQ